MQRATISVSEGRFPEAHFGNRRIMEPSIGYAITRLSAQARSLGTGITVDVDDRGTRLSLTIDAEGRLHTPPGAWAQGGAPTEARSDSSASTQALPVTPEGPSAPQQSGLERRTFTPDWSPAPAMTAPAMTAPTPRAQRPTGAGGGEPRGGEHRSTRVESATSEPVANGFHPTPEHSNHAVGPHASPIRSGSRTRPVRTGMIATLVVAALALCGAGLLLL